jgi:DNA polymerase-3 subunit delta'
MFDPALLGHQALRQRLLDRASAGRLGRTLLFAGPDGIGKRRVALELAMRELCFRRTACGQCGGCAAFRADPLPVELPNLLRIAPEGKAGLIRIGAIRGDDVVEGGVIAWASLAPPPGCHRLVLIEDAHRLHGPSANILLKVLEEPPPHTRFILVTHRPESMLQTIRSRAERIPFGPLSEPDAWCIAERAGWAAGERARWIALSEGTLRYLDEGAFARAVAQVDAWIALARGAAFRDAAGALLPEKDAELGQGEQLRQALELLLRILAEVARIRAGAPPALSGWEAALQGLAATALAVKPVEDLAFEALRHLVRNPQADLLLREVALALRPAA